MADLGRRIIKLVEREQRQHEPLSFLTHPADPLLRRTVGT